MIKKFFYAICLFSCMIFCLTGCFLQKKKTVTKQQPVQESVAIPEESVSSENVQDEILNNIDFESLIVEAKNDETGIEQYEDVDEYDFNYNKEQGIFTVNSVKVKTKKRNNIIIVKKELRGTINNLFGTFLIEAPYSELVNSGDEINVSYNRHYDYDMDIEYITDIKLKFNRVSDFSIIQDESNIIATTSEATPSEINITEEN